MGFPTLAEGAPRFLDLAADASTTFSVRADEAGLYVARVHGPARHRGQPAQPGGDLVRARERQTAPGATSSCASTCARATTSSPSRRRRRPPAGSASSCRRTQVEDGGVLLLPAARAGHAARRRRRGLSLHDHDPGRLPRAHARSRPRASAAGSRTRTAGPLVPPGGPADVTRYLRAGPLPLRGPARGHRRARRHRHRAHGDARVREGHGPHPLPLGANRRARLARARRRAGARARRLEAEPSRGHRRDSSASAAGMQATLLREADAGVAAAPAQRGHPGRRAAREALPRGGPLSARGAQQTPEQPGAYTLARLPGGARAGHGPRSTCGRPPRSRSRWAQSVSSRSPPSAAPTSRRGSTTPPGPSWPRATTAPTTGTSRSRPAGARPLPPARRSGGRADRATTVRLRAPREEEKPALAPARLRGGSTGSSLAALPAHGRPGRPAPRPGAIAESLGLAFEVQQGAPGRRSARPPAATRGWRSRSRAAEACRLRLWSEDRRDAARPLGRVRGRAAQRRGSACAAACASRRSGPARAHGRGGRGAGAARASSASRTRPRCASARRRARLRPAANGLVAVAGMRLFVVAEAPAETAARRAGGAGR